MCDVDISFGVGVVYDTLSFVPNKNLPRHFSVLSFAFRRGYICVFSRGLMARCPVSG